MEALIKTSTELAGDKHFQTEGVKLNGKATKNGVRSDE
jgi:hypothetical protein